MQIRLEDRMISNWTALSSPDTLYLMRGVGPNMRGAFEEKGIRTAFDLLIHGQTRKERSELAQLLMKQEWGSLRKEEETKLLPDYQEQVDFLVRQIDLMRCTDNRELAYLLAEAGTRGYADFKNADLIRLYSRLQQIALRHPDIGLPEMKELYEMRKVMVPDIYLTRADPIEQHPPHLSESERIRLEGLLHQWESADKISTKTHLAGQIRQGYEAGTENPGFEFAFINMQYSGETPAFLMTTEEEDQLGIPAERTDSEIICEGLQFLQNITVALPLPRTVSGRLTMKRDPFSTRAEPMPGCKVQISGIADSGKDPQPDEEDPFCYTDQDGCFTILMPERYNMKERLTLTVTENQLDSGSASGVQDAADAEHQMTFIRRASEIMDAEYIWANRMKDEKKEDREEVLLRYRKASKDPENYTLKPARQVLKDLDKLRELSSENTRLRERIKTRAERQQRSMLQKIKVHDALLEYRCSIDDVLSELKAHRNEYEKKLKDSEKKLDSNVIEQRKFWVMALHQNRYLERVQGHLNRCEADLKRSGAEFLARCMCEHLNRENRETNELPLQIQQTDFSMKWKDFVDAAEELAQDQKDMEAAQALRLCSKDEQRMLVTWRNAYFGVDGSNPDSVLAEECEEKLTKLTDENWPVYDKVMRGFDAIVTKRNDRNNSEDAYQEGYDFYYKYDPLDFYPVHYEEFSHLEDQRNRISAENGQVTWEIDRYQKDVELLNEIIRQAEKERNDIRLPEIREDTLKEAVGAENEWIASLPTLEQYGVRFTHYLEQSEERMRQMQDTSILNDCGNYRTFVQNYYREQENLVQTWDSLKDFRQKEIQKETVSSLDEYMHEALENQSDPEVEELIENQVICDNIMGAIYDLDDITNDVEQTVRNFLSRPMDAYLGELVLVESAFRSKNARRKALPSVRLMGEGEDAVYLPTDTAPSRIFNFSMMQRLVEPTLSQEGVQNEKYQSEYERKMLNKPINVMNFRKQMREKQSELVVASSLGMGYTLNMHQAWIPDGFALGDLLYSLVLAPGEEQRLIVQEHKESYDVRDKAYAEDGISDVYRNSQDDNEAAVFDQGVRRYSGANSDYQYSAKANSSGTSVCLGLSSFSQAKSSNRGSGSANASQSDAYDEASTAAQNFQTAIKTESARLANAKRSSIRIAGSDEVESVASKIVANHNHSHVMTVQYWEVTRRYRMETCIDSIDLILFVPMQPMHFMPDPSWDHALDAFEPYNLSVEVGFYDYDKKDSAYKQLTRRAFNYRYRNILPYADILVDALPYRYRGGLRLMQKFASLPQWKVEHNYGDYTEYVVTLVGKFLEVDRIWATMSFQGSNLTLTGEVLSYRGLVFDESMNTRKDALYAMRELRRGVYCYKKKEIINSKDHTVMKYEESRPGTNLEPKNVKIEIKFRLPPGVSKNDAYKLTIGRDLSDYQIPLSKNKAYLTEAEQEAVENYYNKEQNLYQDNTDNDKDKEKMAHYWENVPECYKNPMMTLTRQDILGLGSCNFKVTLDDRKDNPMPVYMSGESTSLYLENRVPTLRFSDFMEMESTLHHICDDTLRYSQVIWSSMSDDERIMMLEPYTVAMDFGKILSGEDTLEHPTVDVPLLSCVNAKKLIGFYGNCMMLPFIYPKELAEQLGKTAAEVQDELYRFHTTNYRVPTTTISVPTEGMVGEAVLGATNVSEKIDITRFWNWKDSEIDKMDINQSSLGKHSLLDQAETLHLDAPTQGVQATGHISPSGLLNALTSRAQPTFADALKNTDIRDLLKVADTNASAGREKIVDANSGNIRSAFEAIASVASAYLGGAGKKKEAGTGTEQSGSTNTSGTDFSSADSSTTGNEGAAGGGGTTGGAEAGGTSGGETSKPADPGNPGGGSGGRPGGGNGGRPGGGKEPGGIRDPGIERPDHKDKHDDNNKGGKEDGGKDNGGGRKPDKTEKPDSDENKKDEDKGSDNQPVNPDVFGALTYNDIAERVATLVDIKTGISQCFGYEVGDELAGQYENVKNPIEYCALAEEGLRELGLSADSLSKQLGKVDLEKARKASKEGGTSNG